MGEWRYGSIILLDLNMQLSAQLHTSAALSPVPIREEAG
jgi:hypothetical protein